MPIPRRGRKAPPEPQARNEAVDGLQRRWQEHLARGPWAPSKEPRLSELRIQAAALEESAGLFVEASLTGHAEGMVPPLERLADLLEQAQALLEGPVEHPKEVYFLLAQLTEVAHLIEEAAGLHGSSP